LFLEEIMSVFNVKFAVYGALAGGDQQKTQAINVADAVQQQLNTTSYQGVISVNNTTMGQDPSPGNVKHFGALVTVNGKDMYFACQENQTIDFNHNMPAALRVAEAVK
jgi:hypothetical protein